MKNKALLLLMFCWMSSNAAHSASPEDEKIPGLAPSLMDQTFVYETSDEDVDSSLNRLSGDFKPGFAAEEYTYKSENHGAAGPMERQKRVDRAEHPD